MSNFSKCIVKLLLTCGILLFFVKCTQKQPSPEFLQEIKTLEEKSQKLQQTNLDSAILLQQEALEKARFIKDIGLQASLLRLMGISYAMDGQLDKSDSCTHEAIRLLPSPEDSVTTAKAYVNLGINQYLRGKNDSAVILYKRANEIAYRTGSEKEILNRTLNNIGLVYMNEGQFDSAGVYLQKALKLYEENNDNEGIGSSLLNLGNLQNRMKNIEQADDLYQQAEAIFEKENNVRRLLEIKNNRLGMLIKRGKYNDALKLAYEAELLAKSNNATSVLPPLYNNISQIYLAQKKYQQAIDMQQQSLGIKEQRKDSVGIMNSYDTFCSIYVEKGDYSQAKKYGLLGLQLAERIKDSRKYMLICHNMAEAYGRSGDYETAKMYLDKKDVIKDSLFTTEKYTINQELQTKYETEKKDLALQTAALTIKSHQQRNVWITVFFTLLLVFSVLYYYFQRKKMQQQILLARQSQKVAGLVSKTLTPNCGNDANSNGLPEDKINEILRRLRECMEDKKMFKTPALTLDALAEAINTNRSYLSIIINSRMQKGFTEYVNFYRVEEAKKLLRDTDHKISHISAEAGFGSTQTFYTIFKNFEQLTPTEYRKAVKK